jgi:predicted SnoaL-like aldol condensation-catalyzing enzyme
MVSNKELVVTATTRLFGERDVTAVDELFGPKYVQHSTMAADGVDGLRALVGSLPDAFGYEPARAIAGDDLVVLHGVYRGFGPPLVAFDIFRVADGRIVEHWDVIAPLPAELPHDNGAF